MGQCYNSVVVHAPVDEVWGKLREFFDMSWAPNVVTKLEVVGEKSAVELGARRRLNDAILETLIELDDDERFFVYTVDDGPGPLAPEFVDRYVGRVHALPVTATGHTFVQWTSDFATRDDGAVGKFCDGICQAILNDLAARYSPATVSARA